ncbi:MepB family protein [Staphylococcus haemolyticus]|uniref:MepB family protein n=1 Tax=Staphylococcus haemolyticus TaxID=1283 RepID=UPI000A577271|nr:MepB family protein [Staphylococcus haemolyticus]
MRVYTSIIFWMRTIACLSVVMIHTITTTFYKFDMPNEGYFFAMWKKDENNTNVPFTEDDLENQLIVNIVDDNRRGQFIFPKDILIKKGILKSDDSKGKMALRVYPPWETELNKTAAKTQAWQCAYFNEIVHE